MNITLDELLAFVTVADTKSITAAAKKTDQTASSVSRALSRLEGKLQVTLFHRSTRRVTLTKEGAVFLVNARQILNDVSRAQEQVMRLKQKPAGRLNINAASPFMFHVIAPMMPDFLTTYPDIELELVTDDLFIDLLEQKTDIAIRIGTLSDSGLHAYHLADTRLRILASPAYLKCFGEPQTIEELITGQHKCLGFTQPESLNHWPLTHNGQTSVTIKPVLSVSNGELLRQVALQGQGISCLSDFMTAQDRQTGQLVQILSEYTVPVAQPIYAVHYYHTSQLTSRAQCFIEELKNKMKALNASEVD